MPLGAIIGDIIGSRFERFDGSPGLKLMEFDLYHSDCRMTDDSYLTLATIDALIDGYSWVKYYKQYGRQFSKCGFGQKFKEWAKSEETDSYGSWGNGSAMRVSPIGWFATSIEEVLSLARESSEVTHDHPDAIIGAQATALSIFLAKKYWCTDQFTCKTRIKVVIEGLFGYDLSTPIAEIRPTYKFEVSAAKSVPQAIRCFIEGRDYEETIRLAISLGGDTDTQAAIAGSIAEAYYGIPAEIWVPAQKIVGDFWPKIKGFKEMYCKRPDQDVDE